MDILSSFVLFFFKYAPLMAGAYLTIMILRVPDLTVEVSWTLSAIGACMVAPYWPLTAVPLIGAFIGACSGLITGIFFVLIGRKKLLAALLSYTIQIAIGYHLLGDRSSIYISSSFVKFGLQSDSMVLLYYAVIAAICIAIIVIFERSQLGIMARMIGENPYASIFYKLSLNKLYVLGFILGNMVVGLGGATWGLYYGFATNTQGIGLIFSAFLALLLGDEVLKLSKVVKRTSSMSIVFGTILFVILNQLNEWFIATLQLSGFLIRSTDKNIFFVLVLAALLAVRRANNQKDGIVSQW